MDKRFVTVNEGGTGGRKLTTALDPSISDAWRKYSKKREDQTGIKISLTLPSGLPILASRMPLRYLIRKGLVPDPLTSIVREHIELIESTARGGGGPEAVEEAWNADLEGEWVKWIAVMDTVWIACVAQPSFTDDEAQVGADGAEPYHVGDVDYLDKLYVYQWAQGVDESVADFLQSQAEIVGRLADSQDLRDEAKPALRVDRRGGRMVGVVRGPGDVDMGLDGGAVAGGDGGEGRTEASEERTAHDERSEVRSEAVVEDDLRPAPTAGRKTGGSAHTERGDGKPAGGRAQRA